MTPAQHHFVPQPPGTHRTAAPAPQSPLQLDHLQNPAGEGNCQLDGEHALFLSLAPRPVPYVQTQDGRTYAGLYRPGDMLITPANVALSLSWQGEENCVMVRLADHFLRQVGQETMGDTCDRIQLRPAFQVRNPQLEALIKLLHNESQQTASGQQLYLDSLANLVAVELLRQHATTTPKLPQYRGGLPPRQLQQVLDYVDAHLDQNIKLETLAQLLDMSQFHFSRLFKQSLGASPYQYLIQQRVERAKQLLQHSNLTITDIALDCGFSSHSHLSKQFRQVTGMTPKAYRGK